MAVHNLFMLGGGGAALHFFDAKIVRRISLAALRIFLDFGCLTFFPEYIPSFIEKCHRCQIFCKCAFFAFI